MNGLVSIITPTYNSAKYIAETINSVQQQSYTNWEMLIVDDCSNDNTITIIQEFMEDDFRIHLIQSKKNSGAGVARQKALEIASGQYIAFLDADDIWKSEKLKKQIDFMKKENTPFTFSFYDCINEDSKSLNLQVQAPIVLRYNQLFFCNFVGNLTGIYDAKALGKIQITTLRKRQDWVLWLTILKIIRVAKPVPESLAYYRIRKDSLSTSKVKLLKHNYAVYRKFHQYNVMMSLLCMIGFLYTQLLIKPRYIKSL